MEYTSINIQGNIITGELISQLRDQEYKYQKPQDFGFDKNTNLRDEIGNAWAVLRRQWETFKIKKDRLDENASGMTETRQYWVSHFLNELGYEIQQNRKKEQDTLPHINYSCKKPESFPIQIEGYNQSLDKRPKRGGSSPHARMQEYLNKTDDHLYGLITNGKYIRLLRDASRLVKLTYLEFDLYKIMEDELYADFALLYRILHYTRMPQKIGEGDTSIIEQYHQDSLAAGTRIRTKLSEAVEKSIVGLANGFLQHPGNKDLQEKIKNGEITPLEFYQYMLRLIYRILFLTVIEERNLVYDEKTSSEGQRLQKIYYRYYSIQRLRKLADNHHFVDKHKQDLWDNLRATFRLFQDEKYGKKLGVKPLAGDLFSSTAIGILADCYLSNRSFMQMMLWLNFFENENKQLVRVNYGDLDVEEFGSVYEGLLEYDPHIDTSNGKLEFSFIAGDARARSGSHYTPEELVKPLIKHSLDYILNDCIYKPHERLNMSKEEALKYSRKELQEKALLDINVCDVTCGSGHILLSAARRIATSLAVVRSGDDQPDPSNMRIATRDVIRNCIYGVDLNPLAVELCKVSLWLEAHTPGEPLNFLDHRIKCGDAIVGLTHKEELDEGIPTEAFKSMSVDDREIARTFWDKNKKERKDRNAKEVQLKTVFEKTTENSVQEAMKEYRTFNNLPESTPAEIERKAKAYKKFIEGKGYAFLKAMADTKVAQFFIPKTNENKDRLMTDVDFRQIMTGYQGWTGPKTAYASSIAQQRKFFHYFLEFPEIFSAGGFDCILGNPPYLGGNRINRTFGTMYCEFIKKQYSIDGNTDLVVYFLNKTFNILNSSGNLGLITSQSTKERTSRIDGLLRIINWGGIINYAFADRDWPGKANTKINLICIHKRKDRELKITLNNKNVLFINSFLSEDISNGSPEKLLSENNKGFVGSYILGEGFILGKDDAFKLMKKDKKSKEIVCPLIIGDDINKHYKFKPSRYVINFYDFNEDEAKKYKICYDIIESKVKPYRINQTFSKSAKKFWWQYERRRPELYDSVNQLDKFLVTAKTSKHLNFVFFNPKYNYVFDQSITVLPIDKYSLFSVLHSNFHFLWARKYSTTQGGTPRYNTSDTIERYPFPSFTNQKESYLAKLGENFDGLRQELLNDTLWGLTNVFNIFHSPKINKEIITNDVNYKTKDNIVKQFGTEFWKLHTQLQKTENDCSLKKIIENIEKLRELQVEMDNAVLEAYGWSDIDLRHDFYEMEYLPENDRVRFTIHPDARKEVLKRLLLLNHERFEEEAKKGLHKEKVVREFYQQKGKEVPKEIIDKIKAVEKEKKNKTTKSKPKKKKGMDGQGKMF